MKNACWMVPPEKPPCFIQLGRFGDLILLFPAFKAVFDRTGLKPVVIVSMEYASVFDGISYAQPVPVHWHWWEGVPNARRLAEEQFGGAIIPQWWNEHDRTDLVDQQHRGGTVLQCHGHEWGVDPAKWPNYMTSMWDRAGFSAEEMRTLPLIFDRRDAHRERVLVAQQRGNRPNPKPMLVVNWSGVSSPLAAVPEMTQVINRFAQQFQIVNLGNIKAQRIYDLLGLYDVAAGLVTIDTATLHLAAASKVPYIAFTRSDWSMSVPKGNCVLEIKYGREMERRDEMAAVLERWAGAPPQPFQPPHTHGGGGGAILAI